MGLRTIAEFAYPEFVPGGIGERNTVSSGTDADPNSHTGDLLASHFDKCKRHGTTQAAMTNILASTGGGINIGGHGDQGFLETGGGQGGPWPDHVCITWYNETAWGPLLDRLKQAAVTSMSIWSCHVGAGQEGAELLFAMAKRCGRAVRAGTGFLFVNSQKIWWEPGTVWQVATPTNKPQPIDPPSKPFRGEVDMHFALGDNVFDSADIVAVELNAYLPASRTVAEPVRIEGADVVEIVSGLFASDPLDLSDVYVPALTTGIIGLLTKDGRSATFDVFNGRLAIERASRVGFYLSADLASLIARY